MKKWGDKKDFNSPPFYLVESGKVDGWKKYVYINFTHIPLLKSDALLNQTKKKKKSDSKSNHPNLLGNKNHI